ncbi:carboxymuconolactone decarboxylase family protein [Conexibacter sp. JD483]|uniref:carboxymuconolactone decarboxylase family protein n=1 Tax=unclassified Conexibacter TaxID=2627773 RepID=UPI00271A745F|nr:MULTISPECIES: carboxymuconolactone decarboxylase family protein [unclassified Conexibacter]MDO8185537.1 carboxymuconolactone decarboxylase family protein [Conexibacter sp. CPCC 205706]MDO8197276.1 carboxymuconolactone decarboxylase family protein [Conexibacter sp. CPCC 205762]MDR9370772.1 carboxymuconolactone decarboxylase family protein [Conexibacter sp. JD483]
MHTTPRIDLFSSAAAPMAAMVRLEERIELDATIRELVKLRASIVNGCAFCIDMHWTEARRAGESELRLAQVASWDESPYFDARERAALALTDAITAVGETRVPDPVWEAAAEQFEQAELANLVVQIAAINFWNRAAIAARSLPASWGAGAEATA